VSSAGQRPVSPRPGEAGGTIRADCASIAPLCREFIALRLTAARHVSGKTLQTRAVVSGAGHIRPYGALRTERQAAGSAAIVIGGLGFGATFGGFGCSTASENQ
jgi:hypothetical protein